MEEFINDLDKKISKAENITGNLFDDLTDIRISFNRLKKAINYSQCCKSDSEQLPKKLSASAYTQAMSGNYEEFVKWWDSQS